MHFRAALTHLHLIVYPFLHLQCISSWQDADTSGSVVHIGCHPVSSFHQPQSFGLGSLGMRVLDRGWWYTCIFHWQSEMRMKVSDQLLACHGCILKFMWRMLNKWNTSAMKWRLCCGRTRIIVYVVNCCCCKKSRA